MLEDQSVVVCAIVWMNTLCDDMCLDGSLVDKNHCPVNAVVSRVQRDLDCDLVTSSEVSPRIYPCLFNEIWA